MIIGGIDEFFVRLADKREDLRNTWEAKF